ncbi:MAG: aldehyde dehydrogenase family protein, partial [Flavobacteriales bacterium]|nr:aldehyde dehydrogenase family protein [Flavobacteriales bacterium]
GCELYQSTCELPRSGFWCRPTLFTNVAQRPRIAQEEIFGPVLAIQPFRTMHDVIPKANTTPYAPRAGVWTNMARQNSNLPTKLRAGVVWANTFNKFDPTSPFGGYKESGYGREGGVHGLGAYLKLN